MSIDGNKAVAELFQKALLSTLIDFKFTDFLVEPFSFIVLIDTLVMNPSIMFVDFSRNEINEDTAAAIIGRLY